jgi:hypothetical protein
MHCNVASIAQHYVVVITVVSITTNGASNVVKRRAHFVIDIVVAIAIAANFRSQRATGLLEFRIGTTV